MSEFSDLIKECRNQGKARGKDRVIYNTSRVHAKELFLNLIDDARSRGGVVKIVSGNLDKEFYSSFIDVTKDAINKKNITVKLAILNPDADIDNHPFVDLIREKGEVYKATSAVKVPHFISIGDDRFRLETDHNQAKAIACFNNPQIGKILNSTFDKLIELEEVVKLPAIPASN